MAKRKKPTKDQTDDAPSKADDDVKPDGAADAESVADAPAEAEEKTSPDNQDAADELGKDVKDSVAAQSVDDDAEISLTKTEADVFLDDTVEASESQNTPWDTPPVDEVQEKDTDDTSEAVDKETISEAQTDEAVEMDQTSEHHDEVDDPDKQPDEGEDVRSYTPEPDPQPVQAERKGGFVPMLLGGGIAAAIGFGAAYILNFSNSNAPEIEALSQQISQLEGSVNDLRDDIPAAYDDTTLASSVQAVSEQSASLSAQLSSLSDRLTELDQRITDVETRPVAETSQAAIAAFERELQSLRDQVADERQAIEGIAAEAAAMEDSAEDAANTAAARAAMGRIQAALESGSAYANALGDLEQISDIDVPDALSNAAQTGVATVIELQDSFPDAARSALAEYRSINTGDTAGSRLTNFLRTQTGARSVEPREGDDPDAILSRAEAATRNDNLTDALAEIETLPDIARSQMAAWVEQAQARLDALAAAETLSQELFSN
ncbi:hypothetical protein [Pseudaestuariivita rosea]|uniref:hypothetical protein n=1 Tax=Pseudaestuariivita rosea TaxID=2763263 RepID=UPI001ABA83D4|nr:hypothetical protein [Pseudaestuariivita rosea]